MTQLAALNRAVLPQPPSQDIQDFHLVILSQNGTQVLNQFSAYKYNGLDREVACAVAPGGAVKTLTFTGFPHLVACTGGEIIVFRLNDGDGWKDVFYGAITQGWAAKKLPGGVRDYVADAEYLLDGTVTDAVSYPAQDPALIAQDLVRRLRHPALNFNEIDFPQTATTLEGGFEQPGIQLGEALNLLGQSVADAGRTISYGVDGRGFVFFKELTGTLDVPYYPEDYTDLPIKADDTVTAVLWVIGNEPSDGLRIESGQTDYSLTQNLQWSTLTYLSIPDKGAHNLFSKVIARTYVGVSLLVPEAIDRVDIYGGFTVSNGSYTQNQNSAGFQIFPLASSKNICGLSFNYRLSYGMARPFIAARFGFLDDQGQERYTGDEKAVFQPNYTEGSFTPIELKFPPVKPFLAANGRTYTMNLVRFFVNSTDAPTNFIIKDFKILTLNTSLLDAAAIAEFRTPAQEPVQLILRRAQDRNRVGYYAPPLPKVKLETGMTDAAEYRYAFDRTNGISTVVDLGSPSREGDAALADRIRLAIDTTTRQSEIRTTIGRL